MFAEYKNNSKFDSHSPIFPSLILNSIFMSFSPSKLDISFKLSITIQSSSLFSFIILYLILFL